MAERPSGYRREDKDAGFPHRRIYFHIKGKRPEVHLHVLEGKDKRHVWAKKHLSRIRGDHLVYYKPDCSRKSPLHAEKSISKAMSEDVNENLTNLRSAVCREPSVKGILFQARFGSLYFLLPSRCNRTLHTDELLQQSSHREFLFGIPFDPQYFIQGGYLDTDSVSDTSDYYKVYFVMDGVGAASRMDRENDTFKHVWTRAKTRESKWSTWNDKTKLDIVRPGRLVDIRVASILDRPCCTETENPVFTQTAEKIAKSMKVSAVDQSSGYNISMQITGDNYYVYCIRKKSSRVYKWKENPEWNIVHCQSNTSVNISENESKEMWKINQLYHGTVKLNTNTKEELYFNGPNHPTKPTTDPDTGFTRKVTTDRQFLSDFENFVSASFDVAEMLEDKCRDAQ